MKSFRMRLILALVVGVTLVSVGSTYFEVLAHKHSLRLELQRRTSWTTRSMQAEMQKTMATRPTVEIAAEAARLSTQNETLGLAVYSTQGGLVTETGPADVFAALSRGPLYKALKQGIDTSSFGHKEDRQWLEEAIPLYVDGHVGGALVVLEDAQSIHDESERVWRESFWIHPSGF